MKRDTELSKRNAPVKARKLRIVLHLVLFVFVSPFLFIKKLFRELRKNNNDAMKVALVLAVLLHLTAIFPLWYMILQFRDTEQKSENVIVDLWSEDSKSEEKTPEEQLEDYKPEAEILDGQVIQMPAKGERRPPKKDTKFLSEKDNSVEKETSASIRIPGMTESEPSFELLGEGESPKESAEKSAKSQKTIITVGPSSPMLKESDEGEIQKTETQEVPLENIKLKPSESAMRAALAGTGLDRLEGIIEGDNTAVNTKGWEYASFFNRVKSAVERYWHPDREYSKRDPYGNIYGFKDRTTVLLVVLRADGSLKKAYIMEPSGAGFLDDVAVSAVTSAAPFSNVPKGLVDPHDSLVKFTFHFIVRVGSEPVFRMRKY